MTIKSEIETLFGKTVNVYKITENINDRGDVTKSTASTISAVCEIQILSGDETEVRSGILKPNDAIGFFKSTENISIGDEIEYQNDKYLVIGLYKEQFDSDEVFQEAHLKKIIG